MNRLLFFAVLWFAHLTVYGQVHINEFSASNLNTFLDAFGKTEDWIELYNISANPVDIGGWHLSDKESKPGKWDIPAGTIIGAGEHLVFFCSGRDLVRDGEFHTNFKLAQTKGSDIVLLSDSDEMIIEQFALDLTLVEHSRCRSIDGGADWMVCTNPTLGASNNSSMQYLGYTVPPSMDLPAGFYTGAQTVTIQNNESNSILRYTLDGTNPTNLSPMYSSPISVTVTTVIKAQSFSNDSNVLPGKMEFNTYFIDEDFTLAVFSVAADSVLELAAGAGDVIPIGAIEYFNVDGEREATSFGSLNRHGQDSWVLPHRSLDWVSRDEMGYSKAVDAPLFSYSDRDEYQKFMFRNSGDDNYPALPDEDHEGSTHIRDEYVQTLAQEGGMKLDLRAVERVILFLNGKYWGVYGMRERPVDHDYTDEYYDQGKYDIEYLSTWGDTEIEYGGEKAQVNWERLRDFILENDMSDPMNYTVADDSINLVSMIDYFIMNLNVVASDWLNYNTGWWRGLDPDGDHKKWGYILWDLDATFDYYINYSGVPNTNPDADPCDLEEISEFMDEFFFELDTSDLADCATILDGTCPYPISDSILQLVFVYNPYCCSGEWDDYCQSEYDFFSVYNPGGADFTGDVGKHEKILLKLLTENETFKQLYYSRYADLMNTVFTCENMMETLDRMLAVIEPEMPRQISRWGGSMAQWQSNVQELKDFIGQRCELLDDGMLECYDELHGPYQMTLLTEPAGIGEIDFNTLDIEDFPWKGDYFGGMENNIKAKVFKDYEDDYVFSHWISTSSHNITPSSSDRKAKISITQPDTLIAVFELISGTEDIKSTYGLSVYPNPANDHIWIDYYLDQSRDVHMELLNALGQQIKIVQTSEIHNTAGENAVEVKINADETPSGIYFLRITIDGRQGTFKVNIEN